MHTNEAKTGFKSKILAVIAVGILVFIDQITKYLAVVNLYNSKKYFIEIIPDVFELRYLENQSAAFGVDILSILQNIFHFKTWEQNPDSFLQAKMILFSVITLIVVVLLMLWYVKIPAKKKYNILKVVIVFFVAGAIGNLIDRVLNNYVVDFFYFKLINFPIFNVADIYVTVAAFAFIILGLFYYSEKDFDEIIPKRKSKG